MSVLNVAGTEVSIGVLETIISVAIRDVPGVTGLARSSEGITRRLMGQAKSEPAVVVETSDGKISKISVHLAIKSGFVLPDIAIGVRRSVVDALRAQLGLEIDTVDVFIDSVSF
ncbi:MAG: Asp23/Gls24 family envelope stress response protein [Eggerthellaceae bacterium]|nr:Asp23/Gls24 family envelope stress response protein [Eggerthellaceae bacterium]